MLLGRMPAGLEGARPNKMTCEDRMIIRLPYDLFLESAESLLTFSIQERHVDVEDTK